MEEAHNSFSTAIMLCTALPDGWLSWGAFCDARSRTQGGTAWLDHTVTAYLQVCPDPAASTLLLPRCSVTIMLGILQD